MLVDEHGSRARLADRIIPSLLVHNLEETLDFYQNILGFTVSDLESEGHGPSWAIVERDGVAIQFFSNSHRNLPAAPAFSGMLRLFPEDLDALISEIGPLVDIEWTEQQPDGKTCEAAVRDPNGYVLAFCSEA